MKVLDACISILFFLATAFAISHGSKQNGIKRRQQEDRNEMSLTVPQSGPSAVAETSSARNKLPTTTKHAGSSSTKPPKTTANPTSKTYDPRLPAGGISMLTPNALTTQYYKIKDHVTFVWNYTSLSATPSAIDVLASIAAEDRLYTISTNVSVEQTQSIVWDTGAYQSTATVPLMMETYTLIVHDAAKDISATPQAGYLGVANQFTFAMYEPKETCALERIQVRDL